MNSVMSQNVLLSPLVLHWPRKMRMADKNFFEFCRANRELRIELSARGDCEIMAPTGGETSWRNSRLITLLSIWAEQDGRGAVFDSSGGFILPNGAIRSPDVSWVEKSKLAKLTAEQKLRFLPLCPDFVIELRSPSDSLKALQDKMKEYVENGSRLGWLIDPESRQVSVYRPNGHGNVATPVNETSHARFPHPNPPPRGEGTNEALREFHNKEAVTILENPSMLTANEVLAGFELDMRKIWDVGF